MPTAPTPFILRVSVALLLGLMTILGCQSAASAATSLPGALGSATASGYNAAPRAFHEAQRLLAANPVARVARIAGGGDSRALPHHPVVFEPSVVAAETTTEGADIGATTAHGAERVAGAGATRGGVLSPQQILEVRGSGEVWSQADGAAVRVLQNQAGRFNVVVDGDRGLITTFSNLSQKSFDRLANNYGWTP